eukprot:jgi/Mesvir1/2930/Mv13996-RA.2
MDSGKGGKTRLSIDSQLPNENSFGLQSDSSGVTVTAVLAAGRLLRPLRSSVASRRRRASNLTDSLSFQAVNELIAKDDVTARRYLEERKAISFQTKEYQEHPDMGWMPSLDFYKYLAVNPMEEAENEVGVSGTAKDGTPSCVPPPSPHLQLRMPTTVIINGFDVQCYYTSEEGYLMRKDDMPTVAMCERIVPRGMGLGADGTPVAILKYQKGRGKHHLNLIQHHDLQRQLETARHTQSLCGVQQYIDCQGTKVCVARLHWKADNKGCMVYKITNVAGKVLGGEELSQRKARLAAESKPTFYQTQVGPPPGDAWATHVALPSQVSGSTLSASLPRSMASPKGPATMGGTFSRANSRLYSGGARQPRSVPTSPHGRGGRFELELGSEFGFGGSHARDAEDGDAAAAAWEDKKMLAVTADNYVTNHLLLHGVSITKVSAGGRLWQEPMEMTQRMVRYVDRRHLARHGRRILELVADFIKDTHGVWWFIEVKAFILSEPVQRVRPPKPGPPLRRKGCCGDYCFALEALQEILAQQEQTVGDRPSRPQSAGQGGHHPAGAQGGHLGADASGVETLDAPGEERYSVSFRVIVEDRCHTDEMSRPQWYYWQPAPDHHPSEGHWVPYGEEPNLIIERAVAMSQTHAKLTPKVSISFKAMQQYELGSHHSTDIKREPPLPDTSTSMDRPASAHAAFNVKPTRQVPVCGVCFRIYLHKGSAARHRAQPRPTVSPNGRHVTPSTKPSRPKSPVKRDQLGKTSFFLGNAVTALDDTGARPPSRTRSSSSVGM